jgi:hypothetical protein
LGFCGDYWFDCRKYRPLVATRTIAADSKKKLGFNFAHIRVKLKAVAGYG